MSEGNEKIVQKWNTVKEQLVALCALHKMRKESDEFISFLCENIELQNLNSQNLNLICYYVFGFIDPDERNKLIQWPLINIKTNTKFRKGVTALVNNFQEKYPWAHIKKLPESYFMNPHGYQSKIVDFVSRLTNLAIHISLDDSELLFMHSGEGVNSKEIAVMTEIISKARKEEEQIIKNNVVPLEAVEDIKNEICDRCIVLRQENDELLQQLNSLKKHVPNIQLVPNSKKTIDITDLKEIRDKQFLDLNIINEELSKYCDLSKELLFKIKAFRNPLSLSSTDLGCANSSLSLTKSTSKVCNDLCQFFQYITLKSCTKEQEDDFFEKLKLVKKSMIEQNAALHSFLSNIS